MPQKVFACRNAVTGLEVNILTKNSTTSETGPAAPIPNAIEKVISRPSHLTSFSSLSLFILFIDQRPSDVVKWIYNNPFSSKS